MRYEIKGDIMPVVEIQLNRGEEMYTQSGGMCWMSDGVEMSTNTKGGFLKGLGRMFAGESLFMATYTARQDDVLVAFSSTVPGEIYTVDLNQTGPMICQKGAFLAAQDSVNLDTVLTKKLSSGLFGGEGFILQRISGSGITFLEVDGNLVEKELAPGEVIHVDTGNVVAFQDGMAYEVETVKGVKNVLFGGEGLFLTRLVGPGKVLLQSQNINEFASLVASMVPTGSN